MITIHANRSSWSHAIPYLTALATLPALMLASGCERNTHPPQPTATPFLKHTTLSLPRSTTVTIIAWRPDGGALAAELDRMQGNMSPVGGHIVLWDLDRVRHHAWMTSGPPDLEPGWLADGSRVLMSRKTGPSFWLYSVDPTTRAVQKVPNSSGLLSGMIGAPTGFQPKPNTVLLNARRSGKRRKQLGVYAWDRDRGLIRPVITPADGDAMNATSPVGGAWIAYTLRKAGSRRLVVAASDGKRVLCQSPVSAGSVQEYALADHGTALIYLGATPRGGEMHKLAIPSGHDTVLARAESFTSTLSVNSRNGDIAVAVQGKDAFPRLCIYDATGHRKASTTSGFTAFSPAWSPDGSCLAYCVSSTRSPRFSVEVIEADHLAGKHWRTP